MKVLRTPIPSDMNINVKHFKKRNGRGNKDFSSDPSMAKADMSRWQQKTPFFIAIGDGINGDKTW